MVERPYGCERQEDYQADKCSSLSLVESLGAEFSGHEDGVGVEDRGGDRCHR